MNGVAYSQVVHYHQIFREHLGKVYKQKTDSLSLLEVQAHDISIAISEHRSDISQLVQQLYIMCLEFLIREKQSQNHEVVRAFVNSYQDQREACPQVQVTPQTPLDIAVFISRKEWTLSFSTLGSLIGAFVTYEQID